MNTVALYIESYNTATPGFYIAVTDVPNVQAFEDFVSDAQYFDDINDNIRVMFKNNQLGAAHVEDLALAAGIQHSVSYVQLIGAQ